MFGRTPEAIAADPGFFSAANEATAAKMGVKRVSIPFQRNVEQTAQSKTTDALVQETAKVADRL
jgi:hypothetical protein